jgi:septal ring factor EnvC (AmiA/AmiB activator)
VGIDPRFIAMNRISLSLLLAAGLFGLSSSVAQTPDANQEQKLLALIKEVQTQQAQMADNQNKIETKLAEINETVREARIFAGRSQ